MAIFVIEDDAQNGPDHVDAHRTVSFVISPCKRGFVDRTLYDCQHDSDDGTHPGSPPLTQYVGATPMFSNFGKTAKLTAYHPRTPKVDLFARNTEKSPFALQSADGLSEYDRIPEDELNRILCSLPKVRTCLTRRSIAPYSRGSKPQTNGRWQADLLVRPHSDGRNI